MGEDIEKKLASFEAALRSQGDPEAHQLLEAIKHHTTRLKQIRGEWDKPSAFRNWNDPRLPDTEPPPLAIESLRSYIDHVSKEDGATRQVSLLTLECPSQGATITKESKAITQQMR